jgi:hypothetical protein
MTHILIKNLHAGFAVSSKLFESAHRISNQLAASCYSIGRLNAERLRGVSGIISPGLLDTFLGVQWLLAHF